MTSPRGIERDVVIVACAISAGVHGALAPRHFAESLGGGAAFLAAAVLLAGLAVALTVTTGAAVPAVASLTFAGLIAGYALAVTTGLGVVHPGPEPVTGLGLATKLVEATGLATALVLSAQRRLPGGPFAGYLRPKGTTT